MHILIFAKIYISISVWPKSAEVQKLWEIELVSDKQCYLLYASDLNLYYLATLTLLYCQVFRKFTADVNILSEIILFS